MFLLQKNLQTVLSLSAALKAGNASKALSLAEKKNLTEAFNFLFSLSRTTLIDELKTAKAAAKRGHIKIVEVEPYLYMTSFSCCACFPSFQFID